MMNGYDRSDEQKKKKKYERNKISNIKTQFDDHECSHLFVPNNIIMKSTRVFFF